MYSKSSSGKYSHSLIVHTLGVHFASRYFLSFLISVKSEVSQYLVLALHTSKFKIHQVTNNRNNNVAWVIKAEKYPRYTATRTPLLLLRHCSACCVSRDFCLLSIIWGVHLLRIYQSLGRYESPPSTVRDSPRHRGSDFVRTLNPFTFVWTACDRWFFEASIRQ